MERANSVSLCEVPLVARPLEEAIAVALGVVVL